jgi:hypothetical protein
VEEAIAFLRAEIEHGPIPARDLVERAKRDFGINERSLQRAREKMGIGATKAGYQGAWVWSYRPSVIWLKTPESLAMICCVMMHPFPGINGVIVGALIPVGLFVIFYLTKANVNYYLDPNGVSGAFEPFLTKYLKLAETMIGLATGSIVLFVAHQH